MEVQWRSMEPCQAWRSMEVQNGGPFGGPWLGLYEFPHAEIAEIIGNYRTFRIRKFLMKIAEILPFLPLSALPSPHQPPNCLRMRKLYGESQGIYGNCLSQYGNYYGNLRKLSGPIRKLLTEIIYGKSLSQCGNS